jgi:hypothetical protein
MQELNKMCSRSNWIIPGYIIVPSAAEGIYEFIFLIFCMGKHLGPWTT